MKDTQGREQKAYIVMDTKTGKKSITYESYAKKLQREGTKKILAQEGSREFEKMKVKESK